LTHDPSPVSFTLHFKRRNRRGSQVRRSNGLLKKTLAEHAVPSGATPGQNMPVSNVVALHQPTPPDGQWFCNSCRYCSTSILKQGNSTTMCLGSWLESVQRRFMVGLRLITLEMTRRARACQSLTRGRRRRQHSESLRQSHYCLCSYGAAGQRLKSAVAKSSPSPPARVPRFGTWAACTVYESRISRTKTSRQDIGIAVTTPHVG
jgi:hypothetical protein